ncbi:hypothetical protein C0995_008955 [Termitomyces sp. Mi166|nr:hypothetical protein C0995_008955 [Termitomyces sp. Mi166\
MDAVAAAMVEAALGDKPLPLAANLVHPRPIEAKHVMTSIQAAVGDVLGKHLDIVPLSRWLSIIEQCAGAATADVLIDIPAIKLLDFFHAVSKGNDEIVSSNSLSAEAGGLASFATEKMMSVSHAVLSQLPSIGREDAARIIEYLSECSSLEIVLQLNNGSMLNDPVYGESYQDHHNPLSPCPTFLALFSEPNAPALPDPTGLAPINCQLEKDFVEDATLNICVELGTRWWGQDGVGRPSYAPKTIRVAMIRTTAKSPKSYTGRNS